MQRNGNEKEKKRENGRRQTNQDKTKKIKWDTWTGKLNEAEGNGKENNGKKQNISNWNIL